MSAQHPTPSTCQVELFGIARVLTGLKTVELPVSPGATLRELIAELARSSPALVGPVIRPDLAGLIDGCVFNLNGRSFAADLGAAVSTGDTVLLLYGASGG